MDEMVKVRATLEEGKGGGVGNGLSVCGVLYVGR